MFLAEETLPQGLYDEFTSIPDFEELRSIVGRHPELLITDFELASLDVDRRLKEQQLLPVVKVKYNFLTESLSPLEMSPFF
ncbi:hypothetical protein [Algoriphagus boritolerans]